MLVWIPVFFVLSFASVPGEFAEALGGTLASQSATAISAGWAAAFLSGTLAFFQVSSSRGADRRLAAAGLGPGRVSVARTGAEQPIGLPDGVWVTTTMKDLHGAGMGGFAIAFVVALVGVLVMESALHGDRRLVVAGFRPGETVLARPLVLLAATALVVAVSALVTALNFTPRPGLR